MPGSYRNIDYTLRPAKAVERQMMGEAFRRLYSFQRIEHYRYVGLGSIYFSDFQMVHRTLGIDDMLSMEKDEDAKECFQFNRPYRSIELEFGMSGDILPTIDWSKKTILWLDYDDKLDTAKLADVNTFCTRCQSGSFLVISVNAQAEPELKEDERKTYESETGEPFNASAYRLRKLSDLVGEKVPPGTDGGSLRGKGLATIFRRIIDNQVASLLAVRNSFEKPEDKMVYRQIFNFIYKDGAQMLTVGGLIFREKEAALFDSCEFDKLNFVRTGEEPYTIRVPCLTAREINHLNAQLPCEHGKELVAPGVPPSDLTKYAEVYRYFPSFREIVAS